MGGVQSEERMSRLRGWASDSRLIELRPVLHCLHLCYRPHFGVCRSKTGAGTLSAFKCGSVCLLQISAPRRATARAHKTWAWRVLEHSPQHLHTPGRPSPTLRGAWWRTSTLPGADTPFLAPNPPQSAVTDAAGLVELIKALLLLPPEFSTTGKPRQEEAERQMSL